MRVALVLTDKLMAVLAKLGAIALRLDAAAQRRQLMRELDDGTLALHATKLGIDDGCVCGRSCDLDAAYRFLDEDGDGLAA